MSQAIAAAGKSARGARYPRKLQTGCEIVRTDAMRLLAVASVELAVIKVWKRL